MTKNELARKIAQDNEKVTIKAAATSIDMVFNAITSALADGEEIGLTGFGKFGTKIQPGREGVITFGEHKGETWVTEDKRVPFFKSGKMLKEAVL